MRHIKTRGSKNSFEVIYVWKDMWNNNISLRWMTNFLYHFKDLLELAKQGTYQFGQLLFFVFFFLIFMRPSFLCTVSFVKIDWKISCLLKNFHSSILLFLTVGWQIAQLMFSLLRTQLFEKFFSYNIRQSN